jgi:hypothetical protein
MNHIDRDIILATAADVRLWAEERAVGTYMEEDLCGMCAIASAELFRRLAKLGYKAELCAWVDEFECSSHCFIVVDDHVLDVTATQFRETENITVFYEHIREAVKYAWYNAQHTFNDVKRLVKWQKKERWASDQIAWN